MENKTERKSFDLRGESKAFAFESIKLYQQLTENEERKEFILSKQYLISSTRIGDLLRQDNNLEAYYAAKSAKYWLELLYNGGYIDDEQAEKMLTFLDPLVRILYVISHPESRTKDATSSAPRATAPASAPRSTAPAASSPSTAPNGSPFGSKKGGVR